jgi:hypothetical protein
LYADAHVAEEQEVLLAGSAPLERSGVSLAVGRDGALLCGKEDDEE